MLGVQAIALGVHGTAEIESLGRSHDREFTLVGDHGSGDGQQRNKGENGADGARGSRESGSGARAASSASGADVNARR